FRSSHGRKCGAADPAPGTGPELPRNHRRGPHFRKSPGRFGGASDRGPHQDPEPMSRRTLCRLSLAGGLLLAVEIALPQSTDPLPRGRGASISPTRKVAYPAGNAIIDVTKPPYGAKGDGKADDTAALQKALTDAMGRHMVIYLPSGTYLISDTLKWSKKNSAGQEAWGFNTVQGLSSGKSIIRLKEGTFTDPAKPRALMWCGGFGSADWF